MSVRCLAASAALALVLGALCSPAAAGMREWRFSNGAWTNASSLDGDFGHGVASWTSAGNPIAIGVRSPTAINEYILPSGTVWTLTGWSLATTTANDLAADDVNNGTYIFVTDASGAAVYRSSGGAWNLYATIAGGSGFTACAVTNAENSFWAVRDCGLVEYGRTGPTTWAPSGVSLSGSYVDVATRCRNGSIVFGLRDDGFDELQSGQRIALVDTTGIHEYLCDSGACGPTMRSLSLASVRDVDADDIRDGYRLFVTDAAGAREYLFANGVWSFESTIATGTGFTAGVINNLQDRFWAVHDGDIVGYDRAQAGGNSWVANGSVFDASEAYVDVAARSQAAQSVFGLRATGFEEYGIVVDNMYLALSDATGVHQYQESGSTFTPSGVNQSDTSVRDVDADDVYQSHRLFIADGNGITEYYNGSVFNTIATGSGFTAAVITNAQDRIWAVKNGTIVGFNRPSLYVWEPMAGVSIPGPYVDVAARCRDYTLVFGLRSTGLDEFTQSNAQLVRSHNNLFSGATGMAVWSDYKNVFVSTTSGLLRLSRSDTSQPFTSAGVTIIDGSIGYRDVACRTEASGNLILWAADAAGNLKTWTYAAGIWAQTASAAGAFTHGIAVWPSGAQRPGPPRSHDGLFSGATGIAVWSDLDNVFVSTTSGLLNLKRATDGTLRFLPAGVTVIDGTTGYRDVDCRTEVTGDLVIYAVDDAGSVKAWTQTGGVWAKTTEAPGAWTHGIAVYWPPQPQVVRSHNGLFSGATGIAVWSDFNNVFVSTDGGLLQLVRGGDGFFSTSGITLIDGSRPYLDVTCPSEMTTGPLFVRAIAREQGGGASCNVPRQDTDGDFDVDLSDFGVFQTCFNGPNRSPVSASSACNCLDDDKDGDVDLGDFGVFQSYFAGPNRPTNINWRECVLTHLDNLITYGTDRYGSISTPMIMSIIDVEKRISPACPLLLDGNVRCEDRPQRRNPRGSNLWYDQTTLRALYRCSQLTSDPKYANAADAYVAYTLANCVKSNGMLVWGSHIFYDAYADKAGGDGDGAGPHETLVLHPIWETLWRINPTATRREIEGLWQWHVADKNTGQFNRHDDASIGCDFAFAGGEFALAFAFLYTKTHDPQHLAWSKKVVDWHWQHRNLQTLLVPDAPGIIGRYDSDHCFTTIPGPYASLLFRCYELTGDTYYRDIAVTCLKAYDQYAWDAQAQTYNAMLQLDGTPVPQEPRGPGYDAVKPTGPIDVWRTIIYSYEFPEIAAETYMLGYEMTDSGAGGDPVILAAARRWATLIEANLPPYVGRRWHDDLIAALPRVAQTGGTYAENYGRMISFFVHLYHATNETHYLDVAKDLAREAVHKLYVNGMFKGHPAKPYYEATDGVGLLLTALLELDAIPERLVGAF